MKVNLGGVVPLSTVDWIGFASTVVFLRGCPLRCPHCQNRELQEGESFVELYSLFSQIARLVKGESTVKRLLPEKACMPKRALSEQINLDDASERAASKPFVNALVLSGGEPLMQLRSAAALLRLAKSLGLETGLETSGYYPDRLAELLEKNVVDRVFLDLKASLREPDYERATGMRDASQRVRESLEACMRSGVPLEVRTTIFPEMPSASEVSEITKTLLKMMSDFPGHHLEEMVLQQGRPAPGVSGAAAFEPVAIDSLEEMATAMGDSVKVGIRAAPNVSLAKTDNHQDTFCHDGRTEV
jgi:pyruvate formate lyase activating enzyme